MRFLLINPPWEDAGILAETQIPEETWLFDIGDISRLRIKDVMRINRIFITHTHIDHFIGADHLLRMNLFSERPVHFYGPEGITEQLGHKLQGYVWNLTEDSKFKIICTEIGENQLTETVFPCCQKFLPLPAASRDFNGTLEIAGIKIRAAQLEHGAPCLGYCLETPVSAAINKKALQELGLEPGPWLAELKNAALMPESGRPRTISDAKGTPHSAEDAITKLITLKPGKKIAYITDTIFNKASVKTIKELAQGCGELWCEACYLNESLEKARANYHMTARQAARLAAELKAEKLFLVHYSRRYKDMLMPHIEEARTIFSATFEPELYKP
ncbi:MAG: MBL fold metallo-hydrolase [bacterium]|nr:MBL fold metallo-hydrolase [bacterium]